jgi:hypothetical protein
VTAILPKSMILTSQREYDLIKIFSGYATQCDATRSNAMQCNAVQCSAIQEELMARGGEREGST